jgi:hypothetical protein
MSTALEQGQQSTNGKISWEDVVRQVEDSTSGRKVIQTKNRKTGLLRHGVLSDAHFKVPGFLIVFGSDELCVARDSRSKWMDVGDGCVEVRIMQDAPPPSVTPEGDITFSVGDTDYRICSQ